MTNEELLRQYVDTGRSIPEYQFRKLPSNMKKTYARKRLIAIESERNCQEYEKEFIPDENLQHYTRMAKIFLDNSDFIDLEPFPVSFLAPEDQRLYIEKYTKNGYYAVNERVFKLLTEENKLFYTLMRIRRNSIGMEEVMKYSDDDVTKPYYIEALKKIEDGVV
jgi:hypothetical protein